MTEDEINFKLARAINPNYQPCTNQICSAKEVKYTRSLDACLILLENLGLHIFDCDSICDWFWEVRKGQEGGMGNHKYPAYSLAMAIVDYIDR